MLLGILQRYVLGEVFRAFLLALLTITSIFVLFMIMAEAARRASPRRNPALSRSSSREPTVHDPRLAAVRGDGGLRPARGRQRGDRRQDRRPQR